jgi:hypothetical protein
MYTIPNIISYAKLSQFLSRKDVYVRAALGKGIDDRLPQLLYIERKSLEWVYNQNPNDANLPKAGNYVLSLCGKFLMQALQAVGGGVSVNANVISTVSAKSAIEIPVRFVVGDSGALLIAGGKTLTISDTNILDNSVKVFVNNEKLYPNRNDRFSYTVSYSSTSIIIQFNQGAEDTWAYDISYEKEGGAVIAPAVSSTVANVLEPVYYLATGSEGNTLTRSDLIDANIWLVFRDGMPVVKVASSPAVGQFSFDKTTGTITFGGDALSSGQVIVYSTFSLDNLIAL